MTAYNREKYLAQAIESVLSSTWIDFELIIVDDGSKDNTVSIARMYEAVDNRVKVYVNEQNLGDYPNRNKAASYATGKYIKYLDSDDIMYPHCLQVMVMAMEKFPNAGYGLSAVGDPRQPYPCCISPNETYLEHFNSYAHFDRAPGSSIIKKEVFDTVGGFKGKKYFGDAGLWFTLSQKYSLVKFQRDLVWDRLHPNSEREYEKKEKSAAKVRKEMLKSFLYNGDCPLNKNEIKVISLNIKKQRRIILIKNCLKRIITIVIRPLGIRIKKCYNIAGIIST